MISNLFGLKNIIVLILVSLLAAGYFQMKSLSSKIDFYEMQLETANEAWLKQNAELDELYQQQSREQQAYLKLSQQIHSSSQMLQQRTKQLENLKRENTELREWANTLVPPDINRLHKRDAITGSESYRSMSENSSLQSASSGNSN